MGADWFYMASGWFGKAKRVGPIGEADLLNKIDAGKIGPETLLQSSKTKGRWVPMHTIKPAMKRWIKLHPEEAGSFDLGSSDSGSGDSTFGDTKSGDSRSGDTKSGGSKFGSSKSSDSKFGGATSGDSGSHSKRPEKN